jgi:hypothetical protein
MERDESAVIPPKWRDLKLVACSEECHTSASEIGQGSGRLVPEGYTAAVIFGEVIGRDVDILTEERLSDPQPVRFHPFAFELRQHEQTWPKLANLQPSVLRRV